MILAPILGTVPNIGLYMRPYAIYDACGLKTVDASTRRGSLPPHLNTGHQMKWDLAARHQILLEITNAVISNKTNEGFFDALTAELSRHFPFDRLSINIYDPKTETLRYFTKVNGVGHSTISSMEQRPLKGSIANMAIQSKNPVIIDDLTQMIESTDARFCHPEACAAE